MQGAGLAPGPASEWQALHNVASLSTLCHPQPFELVLERVVRRKVLQSAVRADCARTRTRVRTAAPTSDLAAFQDNIMFAVEVIPSAMLAADHAQGLLTQALKGCVGGTGEELVANLVLAVATVVTCV